MAAYYPGDTVFETRRGVRVVFAPHSGSSRKYKVRCPHGEFVYARTVAEAREDTREVSTWCVECRVDQEEGSS